MTILIKMLAVAAFEAGKLRSDNPWNGAKTGASREAHAIWDRAWVDASKVNLRIKIGDVKIGDTVAEMHVHETNSGKLKGWSVLDKFEIGESMYLAMRRQLPENMNEGPVIANKYAQVISVNENYSDNTVRSVLVIYVYDFTYWIATLVLPQQS